MFEYKKLTAFISALLIGACAAAAPSAGAFADETDTTAVSETAAETEASSETGTEATTAGSPVVGDEWGGEAPTESKDIKVSGDFSYSLTNDDTVCIEMCTAEGPDVVVPAEIDGKAVTELGAHAFGEEPHSKYTTITFPGSVNYISSVNPFIFCQSLKEIKISGDSKEFTVKGGILFSKDMKTLIHYPIAKPGKSYTVPDGIETISTSALADTELEEIKFPSSLEVMGDYALSTSKNLKSLDLSGTKLSATGNFAFAECSALTEVKFPESLVSIDGGAFWDCTSLAEIELPKYLIHVGQNAFLNTALKEVVIPDSTTSIDYCAFGYKLSQTGEYVADESFTLVGNSGSGAQTYASDMDTESGYMNKFKFMTPDEYALKKEMASLQRKDEGDYEFTEKDGGAYIITCTASDTVLKVPETLDNLPVKGTYPSAFSSCTAEEIVLPEGMESLREMTFYNCTYLKNVTLPQSMKTVGNNCFDSCTALVSADLGGATEIGEGVFTKCDLLASITLSGNCTSIENGKVPFSTCYALEEINVTDGDGNFSSKDGILFSGDGKSLLKYPINRYGKTYEVPKGTKEIAKYAFTDSKLIEDVVLPDSIESIGEFAFYNCLELKKLRAHKGISNIGEFAFGYLYNEEYDTDQTTDREHLAEGFKLYAPKGSEAYDYAKKNDIEVVTGTVRIRGKNISLGFIIALCSAIGAAVIGLITTIMVKKRKKRKKEAEAAERKKKYAEKKAKEEEDKENETE